MRARRKLGRCVRAVEVGSIDARAIEHFERHYRVTLVLRAGPGVGARAVYLGDESVAAGKPVRAMYGRDVRPAELRRFLVLNYLRRGWPTAPWLRVLRDSCAGARRHPAALAAVHVADDLSRHRDKARGTFADIYPEAWRGVLRAASRLAPELPSVAWRWALAGFELPERTPLTPESLSALAAFATRHVVGATVSRAALRRAAVLAAATEAGALVAGGAACRS